MKTEQFIFEEGTDDDFYDFIQDVHDTFVKDLVMSGSGPSDKPLHDIEMVNLGFSHRYCQRVIEGLHGVKPSVHIHYRNTVKCNMCAVDTEHVKGIFLLQQILDYPKTGLSMYSVWRCGKKKQTSDDFLIFFTS